VERKRFGPSDGEVQEKLADCGEDGTLIAHFVEVVKTFQQVADSHGWLRRLQLRLLVKHHARHVPVRIIDDWNDKRLWLHR